MSLRGLACAQKCRVPVEVASLTAMMITIVLHFGGAGQRSGMTHWRASFGGK